jgi:hypothetical protein
MEAQTKELKPAQHLLPSPVADGSWCPWF